jgi:hypothetical protein
MSTRLKQLTKCEVQRHLRPTTTMFTSIGSYSQTPDEMTKGVGPRMDSIGIDSRLRTDTTSSKLSILISRVISSIFDPAIHAMLACADTYTQNELAFAGMCK